MGLFLSIGLIISAVLVTDSLKDIKKSDQDIMVKGYAERNITSDLGVWSCNIRARAFDMVTAYAKLKNDIQKTRKYILSKKIKESNMSIESVNTMKIMKMNDEGRYTNQIIGYELEQKITVSSVDVKLIQYLANESTSLIQDGIEIYSYSPQFFYTKLNNLKIEMLGKATKDAKVRAEQLAKNSDSEVGQLKSARQGVFQITPVNSVDVSDYGEYDLTTIGKTIKAVVTVEFSIE